MNKISSSVLVLSFFIYGAEAAAQQSIWTIHSSTCEAINSAQSYQMESRATGLANRDPKRPLWVICPIISKFFDSDFQDSYIDLGVSNDNSQSIKVNCILRAVELDTGQLTGYSQTQTVNPGIPTSFYWELVDKPLALPSIACKLPPNGVILGIFAGYLAF